MTGDSSLGYFRLPYAYSFCIKLWAGNWILNAVLPLKDTFTPEAERERMKKSNDRKSFLLTFVEWGAMQNSLACATLLLCKFTSMSEHKLKVTNTLEERISNMYFIPSLMLHKWKFCLNIFDVFLPFFVSFKKKSRCLSIYNL